MKTNAISEATVIKEKEFNIYRGVRNTWNNLISFHEHSFFIFSQQTLLNLLNLVTRLYFQRVRMKQKMFCKKSVVEKLNDELKTTYCSFFKGLHINCSRV